MKAHWVAVVAVATLAAGLLVGALGGFVVGLWAGQESASAPETASDPAFDGPRPLPQAQSPTPEPLPQLALEVFSDGCGVIRSEASAGVDYRNLTWVFKDTDGFQVLGRAAESETRYRYFASGQYTVVLEAYHDGSYQDVSNEVTVTC